MVIPLSFYKFAFLYHSMSCMLARQLTELFHCSGKWIKVNKDLSGNPMLSVHILRRQIPYNTGPHSYCRLQCILLHQKELYFPSVKPFQPKNVVQKWANTPQYRDLSFRKRMCWWVTAIFGHSWLLSLLFHNYNLNCYQNHGLPYLIIWTK